MPYSCMQHFPPPHCKLDSMASINAKPKQQWRIKIKGSSSLECPRGSQPGKDFQQTVVTRT
eukprot:m.130899 g.130899  ORF g.130899 m.130899 type:complete len:61 (-) comp13912_c0_seq6:117-299(-)